MLAVALKSGDVIAIVVAFLLGAAAIAWSRAPRARPVPRELDSLRRSSGLFVAAACLFVMLAYVIDRFIGLPGKAGAALILVVLVALGQGIVLLVRYVRGLVKQRRGAPSAGSDGAVS